MSATSGFSRMFLTRLRRVTGTSFGFSSRAMKIEAHGYCVRFAHPVGGSEAGHPLTYEEGGLILTQYVRDRPQTLSASRTRGATREANRRMFVSARSWVMPGRRPQKQR